MALQHSLKLSSVLRYPLFSASINRSSGLNECHKQNGGNTSTHGQSNINRTDNQGILWAKLGVRHFHSSQCFRKGAIENTSIPQPGCDLPELKLPGPVPYIERTTALLMREETQEYLYPLYRRGWEIKTMAANDGFNDQNHKSPFLVGKLTLKGPKSARKILQELMAIEKQEKHHVSFNLWSGKRPVVTVITQTHSARKFDLSESSEVATDYSTEPGITLRDIRLAVLLENFARDSKLVFSPPAGTNEHDAATNPSRFERDSWEDILSRYPWK